MTLEGVKCQLNIFQVLNKVVIFYFNLYAKFILYTRGVNRTEISGLARKCFCSARPGINILQNLYNSLTTFCGEVRQKLMKILLSMGIICDLISVQLQTCEILKTKYYF